MANETIPDLTAGTPPFAPTTLVELAVPDGLGGFVSRKGPLSDVVGMTPLASGTITVPIAYLDLALPSGFIAYELLLTGILTSDLDFLAAAFSQDGGATFVCNPVSGFDNNYVSLTIQTNSVTGVTTSNSELYQSLLQLGPRLGGVPIALTGKGIITPGSSTLYPTLRFDAMMQSGNSGNGSFDMTTSGSTFYYAATNPAPALPVNVMRLLPFGSGDCDPPTSGETIDGGSYALFGVPA